MKRFFRLVALLGATLVLAGTAANASGEHIATVGSSPWTQWVARAAVWGIRMANGGMSRTHVHENWVTLGGAHYVASFEVDRN